MLKEIGTPSLEMNLQLFAEGESTETTVETQTTTETATETQTTGTEQQTTTEQPKIKVKYNHQDMELPYEEAVQHIQKGMNYDKAVERARQEAAQQARDAWIAEQGYEWNGKPITTEAEYRQALKEKEIYDKYQEQGLPPEVIQKLAKVDQIEQHLMTEQQTKAEQQRKHAESIEFLNYFKEENGREFDTEKDTLPPEVIALANQGKSLTDAYAYYMNKQYKSKLAAFETNKANAETSPGSVTGNGTVETITEATINAHANDTNWMMKNYNRVMEFYNKKG